MSSPSAMQLANSIIGGGLNEDYDYIPSSIISQQMLGDTVSALDDPNWPHPDEDLEVKPLRGAHLSVSVYIKN